jgi:hypothetical protein
LITIAVFIPFYTNTIFFTVENLKKQIFSTIGLSLLIQIYPYYDPLHIYWSIVVILGIAICVVMDKAKSNSNVKILSFCFIALIMVGQLKLFVPPKFKIENIKSSSNMRSSKDVNKILVESKMAAEYASQYNSRVIFQCPLPLAAGVFNSYASADRHFVTYGQFMENEYFISERADLIRSAKYPILRCTNFVDIIPGELGNSYLSGSVDHIYQTGKIFGQTNREHFEVLLPRIN